MERVYLKVRRNDMPGGLAYWEEFSVPFEPGMTVMAALMAVREDSVTVDGLPTTPIVWEHNCMEEMCGSCSMVINGKVRQACGTQVEGLSQPIVLEPMGSFPVVRDLRVDRSVMFDALSDIRAWAELDDTRDMGTVRRLSSDERTRLYLLSTCMLCGCCVDACPQINERSPFLGAYLIAQASYHNRRDPLGDDAPVRLETMKGPGGVAGCDNAQNCAMVCPKGIPLGDTIARMQWDVMVHSLKTLFRG